MKHYRLSKESQYNGHWTDLFIVGVTRGAAGVSDFTDSDNDQTITLATPADGDSVYYPSAWAGTKIAFAGDSVSAVALDVGFAGGEEFIKDAAMVAAGATAPSLAVDSAVTAGLVKDFDGSTAITARFIKTGGSHIHDLTAGEVWIYVYWQRKADMLSDRYC